MFARELTATGAGVRIPHANSSSPSHRRVLLPASVLYVCVILGWTLYAHGSRPAVPLLFTPRLAGYANAAVLLATLLYALLLGLLLGRPRLRLASGNVLLLLFLLLGLEWGSRAVGLYLPATPRAEASERGLWVYDRTKGWFHAPHAKGRTYLGGPDAGEVRINSLGLRGREVAPVKEPGVRRVAVLGDSYAFGVGVDEDHLLTSQLEHLLNAGSPRRYDVINMGVSGYSTDQEYLLFRELGRRLAPDIVILLVVANDFRSNAVDFVYGRYHKPCFVLEHEGRLSLRNVPVPLLSGWKRAKLWMSTESNVWHLLTTRTSEIAWVQRLLDRLQAATPHVSAAGEVEIATALIRALRTEVEAIGAQLVVAGASRPGEKGALFEALAAELAKDGMPFLSLKRKLARARRATPDGDWDFPGNPHWNVDSHRVAARAVHKYLERLASTHPKK